VHSYDGRMNIGLVVDPAAMPDPHGFIERVARELDLLAGAVLSNQAVAAAA
jgi:WS/DGAT C-terminal domain